MGTEQHMAHLRVQKAVQKQAAIVKAAAQTGADGIVRPGCPDPCPRTQLDLASAAPLTSVSKPTGTPRASISLPRTETYCQPGLGVLVI